MGDLSAGVADGTGAFFRTLKPWHRDGRPAEMADRGLCVIREARKASSVAF